MRRIVISALALLTLAAAAPARAESGALPRAPVPEARLAEMRGGFSVPGGLDVSMAVETATRLNGTMLLRTTFVAGTSGREGNVTVEGARGATRIDAAGGSQVVLSGDDFEVRHLTGNMVGSIVSNGGNDRTYDSATIVSLDIGNATPANLGSAMLRIDALASDVARRLSH